VEVEGREAEAEAPVARPLGDDDPDSELWSGEKVGILKLGEVEGEGEVEGDPVTRTLLTLSLAVLEGLGVGLGVRVPPCPPPPPSPRPTPTGVPVGDVELVGE